jgi:hypothetical protein
MFMLSFLEIPIGVRKMLEYYRSNFFWQSDEHKKKYTLSKWNILCRLKDQGGLGIEVLELKNKCLLSKWLFKLLSEEGMWQQLLCNQYLKNKTLAQVEVKPTDSHFWKGLMHVKENLFKRGYFRVGDGTTLWMGDLPLSHQYPALYKIVQHKNVLVSTVLATEPINIYFRRGLDNNKWLQWLHLCQRLIAINLTS